MGAVLVHNAAGEPVVLQDALVLVWDALSDAASEDEIFAAVSAADPGAPPADVRREVHRALELLEQVRLAEPVP